MINDKIFRKLTLINKIDLTYLTDNVLHGIQVF